MKITEKIKEIQNNKYADAITIVCIGDSVTQGCFDCYIDKENKIETYFNPEASYPSLLKKKLNMIFPDMRINVINSGISGDKAERGVQRFDNDVLKYSPDLVIIAYGLNDASRGTDYFSIYSESIEKMIIKAQEKGIECIYLTPNFMAKYVSKTLKEPELQAVAAEVAIVQNYGTLEKFIDEGKRIADKYGAEICDMYSIWRRLYELGVDTTMMLANKINHPNEFMQEFIANELLRKILF